VGVRCQSMTYGRNQRVVGADIQERASIMQPAVHDNTAQSMSPSVDAEDESFTACLNRQLRRSELSLTALTHRSSLDISYVSRLVDLPCDPLHPRYRDRGARSDASAATL
jgi:hypothetical protein